MTLNSRWIRCHAQDDLAFRDHDAAYTGLDLELQQIAHLRQPLGTKIYLFPGPNSTREFHAPYGGKKEQRLRLFGMSRGRGDPSRLRECFR